MKLDTNGTFRMECIFFQNNIETLRPHLNKSICDYHSKIRYKLGHLYGTVRFNNIHIMKPYLINDTIANGVLTVRI